MFEGKQDEWNLGDDGVDTVLNDYRDFLDLTVTITSYRITVILLLLAAVHGVIIKYNLTILAHVLHSMDVSYV